MNLLKFYLILAIFCLKTLDCPADNLILKSQVSEKTQTITATLMANIEKPNNILAMELHVITDNWLELTKIEPLKKDFTIDNEQVYYLGKKYNIGNQQKKIASFASLNGKQADSGNVPIIRLTFNVASNKILNNGDIISIKLDSIIAADLKNEILDIPKTIEFTITVGDTTNTIDTTNHSDPDPDPDPDPSDTTSGQKDIDISIVPNTNTEGYNLTEKDLEIAVKLKFNSKETILLNHIGFQLVTPESYSWEIKEMKTRDQEKKVSYNKTKNNEYFILVSSDTLTHPFFPDLDEPDKKILIIKLQPNGMPFGPQAFVIKNIEAGSAYTKNKISTNNKDSLTVNINKLFGKGLGEKGDLQFSDWQCGDGAVNSADDSVMLEIQLKKVELNDYLDWAADINDDKDIDLQDYADLQKKIKNLSSVYVNLVDNGHLVYNKKNIYYNGKEILKIAIYSLTGIYQKTITLQPGQATNLSLPAGLYLYSGLITTADGEQFVKGKIILE